MLTVLLLQTCKQVALYNGSMVQSVAATVVYKQYIKMFVHVFPALLRTVKD